MKKILLTISALLFSLGVNAETMYGFIKTGEDIESINNFDIKLYYSNDSVKNKEIELDNNFHFTIDSSEVRNQQERVVFESYISIGDKKFKYLSKIYFDEEIIKINYHQQAIKFFWGHTSIYFKLAKNEAEKKDLLKQLKKITESFAKYIETKSNEDAFFVSKMEELRNKNSNFSDEYFKTLNQIEINLRKFLK